MAVSPLERGPRPPSYSLKHFPHKLRDQNEPNLVQYIRTVRSHGVVLPIWIHPYKRMKRGVSPQIQVIYFQIFSETDSHIQTKLFMIQKDHAANLICTPHHRTTSGSVAIAPSPLDLVFTFPVREINISPLQGYLLPYWTIL